MFKIFSKNLQSNTFLPIDIIICIINYLSIKLGFRQTCKLFYIYTNRFYQIIPIETKRIKKNSKYSSGKSFGALDEKENILYTTDPNNFLIRFRDLKNPNHKPKKLISCIFTYSDRKGTIVSSFESPYGIVFSDFNGEKSLYITFPEAHIVAKICIDTKSISQIYGRVKVRNSYIFFQDMIISHKTNYCSLNETTFNYPHGIALNSRMNLLYIIQGKIFLEILRINLYNNMIDVVYTNDIYLNMENIYLFYSSIHNQLYFTFLSDNNYLYRIDLDSNIGVMLYKGNVKINSFFIDEKTQELYALGDEWWIFSISLINSTSINIFSSKHFLCIPYEKYEYPNDIIFDKKERCLLILTSIFHLKKFAFTQIE